MNKSELAETKKMWEKEVDHYLFKAATEDLNNYSNEVKHIIIEEGQKRELVDSNGRLIEKSLGTCLNHPDIQAEDRCADCMDVFCSDCLIEIVDQKYCSSCNPNISRKETTLPCEEASSALKYAIIGVVFLGIILEPIAIFKALKAKDIIKANPSLSGSKKVTAALIIAILYILGFILFFSVMNLSMYAVRNG